MQYKKFKTEHSVIEFHNNWLGVETVIINGQIVSKKSSVMGAEHHFSIMEDGHLARYVLTSKLGMNVLIDIRRNGVLIAANVPLPYGTKPKAAKNISKINGINLLNDYQVDDALVELKKALDINLEDPEIYFYLACCYSIEEKPLEGFESLKKAVANRLQNTEMILDHEMLAYLRMHDEFEPFLNSNFMEYDESKLK